MNACRCLNRTKETQLSTWTNEAYETAQYWPPTSCWRPALACTRIRNSSIVGCLVAGRKAVTSLASLSFTNNVARTLLEVVLKGLRAVDLLHIHQGFFFPGDTTFRTCTRTLVGCLDSHPSALSGCPLHLDRPRPRQFHTKRVLSLWDQFGCNLATYCHARNLEVAEGL